MPSRALLIHAMVVAAVAGGLPPRLAAQVAAKSPFLPAAGPNAAAPTAGAPLEFRGFMNVGDGVQFRLFDPAKKAGAWVKAGERNAEFDVVAKQHNEGEETLTIEHQGRTLTLAMRKPKVVSAGNIPQMMPPPQVAPVPPPNVAPAVTQSVVLNPTPADEQRRLEAVAAEVARRRAMREQATQQINQGATPPQAAPGMNPGAHRPPGPPANQPR